MNNKFKKIIYFILALIISVILALFLKNVLNKKSVEHSNTQPTLQDNVITLNTKIELVEAYVTKVVDGDTIWVKIENEEKKVRLIGINCPEYTKEIELYGKEATEYTTQKLLNKIVYLQKDVSETDSYNRLLRYVWTEKIEEINEENISKYLFNYALCYEGLAKSKYYNPDTLFQEYLNNAQNSAKENKRGMWSN